MIHPMNVVSIAPPIQDLARVATRKAVDLRLDLEIEPDEPVCSFDICEALGVATRFTDVNMEGMYLAGSKPQILVSSKRPLRRRNFTCAHELGHHLFGHGTSLDELREQSLKDVPKHKDEWLADFFAAALVMSQVAVERRFALRGQDPAHASPELFHTVSSELGVTYEALVTHVYYSDNSMPDTKRRQLIARRRELRQSLGMDIGNVSLAILDHSSEAPFLVAEVGQIVIAPKGTTFDTRFLQKVCDTRVWTVLTPKRRGVGKLLIPTQENETEVRIMPREFVGLARFRFLEE